MSEISFTELRRHVAAKAREFGEPVNNRQAKVAAARILTIWQLQDDDTTYSHLTYTDRTGDEVVRRVLAELAA